MQQHKLPHFGGFRLRLLRLQFGQSVQIANTPIIIIPECWITSKTGETISGGVYVHAVQVSRLALRVIDNRRKMRLLTCCCWIAILINAWYFNSASSGTFFDLHTGLAVFVAKTSDNVFLSVRVWTSYLHVHRTHCKRCPRVCRHLSHGGREIEGVLVFRVLGGVTSTSWNDVLRVSVVKSDCHLVFLSSSSASVRRIRKP